MAKARRERSIPRISTAVINRLPRYYRYLGQLLEKEVKKTSSKELSEIMNITASQIRQDLNNFGCFGQQGYGYDVSSLYNEIKHILGIDEEQTFVVIGGGNLGKALVNHRNFKNHGFKVAAVFEVDPELIGGTMGDVSVYNITELPGFLEENRVDIGVIAVPGTSAQNIVDTLVKHKVKGIWNFSNVDLEMKDSKIPVENAHLYDSLMVLSYNVNEGVSSKTNISG